MILPDVNVLIYAFRKDVQQHSVSRAWLTDIVLGEVAKELSEKYPGDEWTLKSDPWAH